VDSLLVRGRTTRSSMVRLGIYREAERVTLGDAAIIPIYHPLSAVAIQDDVRGYALSAMGWPAVSFEDVWLSDSQPAVRVTVTSPSSPIATAVAAPRVRGTFVAAADATPPSSPVGGRR